MENCGVARLNLQVLGQITTMSLALRRLMLPSSSSLCIYLRKQTNPEPGHMENCIQMHACTQECTFTQTNEAGLLMDACRFVTSMLADIVHAGPGASVTVDILTSVGEKAWDWWVKNFHRHRSGRPELNLNDNKKKRKRKTQVCRWNICF